MCSFSPSYVFMYVIEVFCYVLDYDFEEETLITVGVREGHVQEKWGSRCWRKIWSSNNIKV